MHCIIMLPQHRLSWLSFFMVLFHLAGANVSTATFYNPPYLPSACYGNDVSQFPSNNLFAAAGEGICDNGASCGRQDLVRCLSAAEPKNACVAGRTIQVKIADRANSSVLRPFRAGTTMVLSVSAFGMIANTSAMEINIEFQLRFALKQGCLL